MTIRPMPLYEADRRRPEDWQVTTCPACGRPCWETPVVRLARVAEPDVPVRCAACAFGSGPITTERLRDQQPHQRRFSP